ncbi:MAG: hypothetical protein Aurels2KO_28160 [Aureliella sp.]
MAHRQDWTEPLGLVLIEDDETGQFWVEIPEPPVMKLALIPENLAMLVKYVETYANKRIEQLDAQQAIYWALLKSVMEPEK